MFQYHVALDKNNIFWSLTQNLCVFFAHTTSRSSPEAPEKLIPTPRIKKKNRETLVVCPFLFRHPKPIWFAFLYGFSSSCLFLWVGSSLKYQKGSNSDLTFLVEKVVPPQVFRQEDLFIPAARKPKRAFFFTSRQQL